MAKMDVHIVRASGSLWESDDERVTGKAYGQRRTLSVALSLYNRTHEDLNWANVREGDLALQKDIRLYIVFTQQLLRTLPVVWYKPKWCRSSSSLTAPGASILLPSTRKGTFASCSIERSASSSAFDSANRSKSALSTRKTMPSTSGK